MQAGSIFRISARRAQADVPVQVLEKIENRREIEASQLFAGGLLDGPHGAIEPLDEESNRLGDALGAELAGRPDLHVFVLGVETAEEDAPHRLGRNGFQNLGGGLPRRHTAVEQEPFLNLDFVVQVHSRGLDEGAQRLVQSGRNGFEGQQFVGDPCDAAELPEILLLVFRKPLGKCAQQVADEFRIASIGDRLEGLGVRIILSHELEQKPQDARVLARQEQIGSHLTAGRRSFA